MVCSGTFLPVPGCEVLDLARHVLTYACDVSKVAAELSDLKFVVVLFISGVCGQIHPNCCTLSVLIFTISI